MTEQVRKPFIYLTIISVVLGIIGMIIIAGNFSGKVVYDEDKLIFYSSEEISSHNNLKDCWIISQEYIYDITPGLVLYKEFSELGQSCGNQADISILGNLEPILESYKIGKLK